MGTTQDGSETTGTLGTPDGLIAAAAAEYDSAEVTRNVKLFESLGVSILNPWEASK
jgi:predicted nucleic acid-binding protein